MKLLSKPYITMVVGFGEMLFFCGPIYGWAALVYVLKEEGYYSHLCRNQSTVLLNSDEVIYSTCTKQDAVLNLVFTIASFVFQGSLFLFGLLFDYFGTRFTRILSHILIVAGLLVMLLSSSSVPHLIFPGMFLLSMGGTQFIPTNMQIGSLFPKRNATVVTALSGALDSSAAVFLFVKLAYHHGISLRTSFAFMICLTATLFINTFLLLPIDYISNIDKIGDKNNTDVLSMSTDDLRHPHYLNVQASTNTADTPNNQKNPTFKDCVCSPLFWFLTAWFSSLQLRSIYYVGTLNSYLVRLTDENDNEVSHYTEVFGYLQLAGLVVAPFGGVILDRNKCRGASSAIRGPYDDLQDTVFGFVVTTTLFVMFSVANVIPILEIQYITFVMQVITRTFLYGITVAAITIMFPRKYFGSLYGLVSTIGSFVLLLQFLLFLLTQNIFEDDPFVINAIFLVVCLLAFSLPMYIYVFVRRNKKKYIRAN